MQAKAKLKEKQSEKTGIIKWYEIKLGRKIVCKMYYPNMFHPESFSIEFDSFTLSDVRGYERAFTAVEKELNTMYGITEIADEKGWPWFLLCCFENDLLSNP